MKKANLIIVTVVAVCLMVVGFFLSQERPEGQRDTFTEEDASRSITVPAGMLFWIDLEENPSTGFTWHYTITDEAVVSFQSEVFVPPDSGEAAAGAPGRRRMQFLAAAGGETVLLFEYYQEWVPDYIVETYEFTIRVQ